MGQKYQFPHGKLTTLIGKLLRRVFSQLIVLALGQLMPICGILLGRKKVAPKPPNPVLPGLFQYTTIL